MNITFQTCPCVCVGPRSRFSYGLELFRNFVCSGNCIVVQNATLFPGRDFYQIIIVCPNSFSETQVFEVAIVVHIIPCSDRKTADENVGSHLAHAQGFSIERVCVVRPNEESNSKDEPANKSLDTRPHSGFVFDSSPDKMGGGSSWICKARSTDKGLGPGPVNAIESYVLPIIITLIYRDSEGVLDFHPQLWLNVPFINRLNKNFCNIIPIYNHYIFIIAVHYMPCKFFCDRFIFIRPSEKTVVAFVLFNSIFKRLLQCG